MTYRSIIKKDKDILLDVLRKETKNLDYNQLSKKTGSSVKYLKLLFNRHNVFIEDALKMCKILDIDIEKYIDIKELNEAIDKNYIEEYIILNDFNKLKIMSYIESQSHCNENSTTFKISDDLLDKIINNGEMTMKELAEKIDMSYSLLNAILNNRVSSFMGANRICNAVGINVSEYFNYTDYKDVLQNGRLDLFTKMDPITKLGIIEYAEMLPEIYKKENYLRYMKNKEKEKKLTSK